MSWEEIDALARWRHEESKDRPNWEPWEDLRYGRRRMWRNRAREEIRLKKG